MKIVKCVHSSSGRLVYLHLKYQTELHSRLPLQSSEPPLPGSGGGSSIYPSKLPLGNFLPIVAFPKPTDDQKRDRTEIEKPSDEDERERCAVMRLQVEFCELVVGYGPSDDHKEEGDD